MSRFSESMASTDTGRALMQLPSPIIAAGIVRGLRLLAQESQPKAARVLGNLWIDIAPLLAERINTLPTAQCAAVLLLEQYFHHSGDWRAMEERLIAGLTVPDFLLETTLAKIARMLVTSARQVP